jgi:hypothetical protein
MRLALAGAALGAMAVSLDAWEAPRIVLAIPSQSATCENFAGVAIPSTEVGVLEISLRNSQAEIEPSSVRLLLNGQSVSALSNLYPTPFGMRVVFDNSRVANRDFHLRPDQDNVVAFEALDRNGNRYVGRFLIRVQSGLPRPAEISGRLFADLKPFEPPAAYRASSIRWALGPENESSGGRIAAFRVEIVDEYGLREVTLELNGKEIETVALENGVPVRKRGGFRSWKRFPGSVEGDGRRLQIDVPVELKRGINVLTVRARNIKDMYASDSRTITK